MVAQRFNARGCVAAAGSGGLLSEFPTGKDGSLGSQLLYQRLLHLLAMFRL